MGDHTDYDHPARPSTAQPAPEHVPGAASVHDLVAAEIAQMPRCVTHPLIAMLAERRSFGLAKYGTTLQVEDPKRRPEMDLLEELADALVYAYRAKRCGVPSAGLIYESLMDIALAATEWWYPR